MAVYNNAEIRQARKVIRANVEVQGFVPVTGPSAGSSSGAGFFGRQIIRDWCCGDTYTLILPDYPPAEIEITDEANPVDGSVAFKGIGEPPVKMPAEQVQESK